MKIVSVHAANTLARSMFSRYWLSPAPRLCSSLVATRSGRGTSPASTGRGNHFRGDDAALRAGENEVIAGGVDSPFVFSVFIA